MSRILATFLDKPEAVIAATVDQLEAKTGYLSHDVRLLAENSQKIRTKMVELGLDPDDSSGEEFYHALLARYGSDCAAVDRALSVGTKTDINHRLELAIQLIGHISPSNDVWAIKRPVARKLLAELAPKRTMKQLGYRSLDSMLKHEDAAKLFLVASATESATWQKSAVSKIDKLSSTDRELRPVEIVRLTSGTEVTSSNGPLGVVGVVPDQLPKNTPVLSIALLLHDQLALTCVNFDKNQFYQVNPALKWWEDAEHLLAWNDGQPISLNFRDVAKCHMDKISYQNRLKTHGGESFWQHLLSRYKQQLEQIPEEIENFGIQAKATARYSLSPINDPAFELEEARD